MKAPKTILAAIAATLFLSPQIRADAPDTMAALPTPAMPASTTTNSTDAVTALFGDPVIASGSGVSVKRSELDAAVTDFKEMAAAQGETISPEQLPELEGQMLLSLIDTQLLLQKATDADKADGAKKADDNIAARIKRMGSQAAFDMQLQAAGLTEDQLRAKIIQQLTAGITLERMLGITVSDEEIKQAYADHLADFEQPEMVKVRSILLLTVDPTTGTPLSDDAVQAKRKQADDILARARSGEDFATLAKEYSDDTSTKDKGGEMPPFARTTPEMRRIVPPEFEATAFSLTNNQISDIIPTQAGYYIIQLIEKMPPKTFGLTDPIPNSDVTISEIVKQGLIQQKVKELAPPYLNKLNQMSNVKILDPDLNSAIQTINAAASAPPAATPPGAGMPPSEK